MNKNVYPLIAIAGMFAGVRFLRRRNTATISGFVKYGRSAEAQQADAAGWSTASAMNRAFLDKVNQQLQRNGGSTTLSDIRQAIKSGKIKPSGEYQTARWAYENNFYSPIDVAAYFDPTIPRDVTNPKKQAKAQKQKKAKELNPFKFASTNKYRPILTGVHYEDGERIATDMYNLLRESWEYPEDYEGKTIDADGNFIDDGKYPPYKKVFPLDEDLVQIDFDPEQIKRAIELENAYHKENLERRKKTTYNWGDALVSLKIDVPGQNESVYLTANRITAMNAAKNIKMFLDAYPDSQLFVNKEDAYKKPVIFRNDYAQLLVMPNYLDHPKGTDEYGRALFVPINK